MDKNQLVQSLHTAFIDHTYPSSKAYQPQLLYNDYHENRKLSYDINQLLNTCDSFDFSVAFISKSGLAVLKQALIDLQEHHKKGRIITSTYLCFNHPDVFRELQKFDNIEVRIYEEDGFHPKGYIFRKDDFLSCIIGSTNLTQTALSENQEWNLYFTTYQDGEVIHQITREFEKQWQLSSPLTSQWIDDYEKTYVSPSKIVTQSSKKEIVPNYMQSQALGSLKALRKEGQNKALLISATGTGKTYLAAFDVKAFQAKRVLFVVHRQNIASKAMESFQTIMPHKSMGLFSGNYKDIKKDYLFATIQTISKEENLHLFALDEFDYIIIDEVHRAGARTYQKLVSYFKPKFLLGMSATPERSDDFDIYKMFDYQIAFEIRLKDAMEYKLLCPFHYYGITDFRINDQVIHDKSDFNLLTSKERVDYIIEKIEMYGYSGNKVHGLIFCSRNSEARELSKLFNERGYHTMALSGEDNENARQKAMDRLESNGDNALDYIFTVDIFNEGIDIPQVNQIVMLRPTQSAIIFVQQLGRGLRKTNQKDYVVVIDFIANYEKNYLIPIALSGSTSYDKDNLRRFISESNLMIPGASSIQFDEISKTRIYESIDHANFNEIRLIKESYTDLKAKIGRIPHLKDFARYGAIDVQRIFQNNNLGSYHMFLKKYEKDYHVHFNQEEEMYLKFISTKLADGKRVQELEAIYLAIEKRANLMDELKIKMHDEYHIDMQDISYTTIMNILNQSFATGSSKDKYKEAKIIENNHISPRFAKLLEHNEFKEQVLEVLDYTIDRYKNEYSDRYKDTDLCLYKKYTYEDVCRLLNFEQSLVPLNIGGYCYDAHSNTLPVFINYDKDESISKTIQYKDHFIDSQTLIAMSKNNKKLGGKGMEMFTKAKERNTAIHIFVRKNKDDKISKEFYYLGEGMIENIKQETMEGDIPVCEILYHLDQPVRKDIYDYITHE